MLRNVEQRETRQNEMRLRQEALLRVNGAEPDFLNVGEAAKILRVSYRTASQLLKKEPGVNLIYTPGSKRPIIRIHRSVLERILRQTANP